MARVSAWRETDPDAPAKVKFSSMIASDPSVRNAKAFETKTGGFNAGSMVLMAVPSP
jgi:hypothetical protein